MNTRQDPYAACLRHAGAQAEGLMRGMIDDARKSIFRRATAVTEVSQRNALLDAVHLLNRHEPALCRNFPELLLEEIGAVATAPAQEPAPPPKFSFEQLELMDDLQVQERVEIARIQQAIRSATEAELAELNRLVCGAQGLGNVSAERNPIRPEVYARALRAVLEQTGESPQVRLAWMQPMGVALGSALVDTYQALCRMLREAGVVPAGYQVVRGGEAGSEGVQAAAGADSVLQEGGTRVLGEGHRQTLLTLERLHQLLAGELTPGSLGPRNGMDSAGPGFDHGPFDRDFSQTVPAAFEALQEMQQVDTVIRRLTSRQAGAATRIGSSSGPGFPPQAQGAGRQPVRSLGQALAQEVVSLMVDNIAGDPRLAEPVRVAIKALQPALLGLALSDPRFFSDRQHPARRLLDEISQRGLGFDATDAAGFSEFIQPVQSAVQALVSVGADEPEPFEVALAALHREWAGQLAHERKRREKAVQALLKAEDRTVLAQKFSRAFRERADLQTASADVVALLLGPWSQVMAHARLSFPGEGTDPRGYGAAASDLLWSAQPGRVGHDRGVLVRMIPGLIRTLREGLASIDFPTARSETFFKDLMALHQQVLGSGTGSGPQATRRTMSRADLEAYFEQADENSVWLVGAEARDSGFFGDWPDGAPQPDSSFAAKRPMPSQDDSQTGPTPSASKSALDALTQPGVWIELWVNGAWQHSQLTWSSPQRTLFMYTSASGGTHSLTLRALERLYDAGEVRLLAGQSLIDGALDAVAQTALRNSVEVNL